MLHDEDAVVVSVQGVVVVQGMAVSVDEVAAAIAGITQEVTLVERRRRTHIKSVVNLGTLLWIDGIDLMKPTPLTTIGVHLQS
jgi:hypothetical protein